MLMCCAVLSRSVMSNSLQPHGAIARQAPLVHEDSSGKTTGVGWHALFLPDPGIKPRSPPLWADSFPSELPGKPKNTGVGSLTLLQGNFLTQEQNQGLLHCRQILNHWATREALYVRESESEVAQPGLTLCDPMVCSSPGSSIHGIFQGRILEWIATSFSRGSSRPRNWTRISHIVGRLFIVWSTREAFMLVDIAKYLSIKLY